MCLLTPAERHSFRVCAVFAVACAALAGCAQSVRMDSETAPAVSAPAPVVPSPSAVAPPETQTTAAFTQRGRISIYGSALAGKRTASGDLFDPESPTMAHRTLPFGTRVRVTNLENQKSVEVIVNDRGPFVPGRIADLSTAAARQIGMLVDGVVEGLLEVIQPSKGR